jgi:CspA family cold shock protein
MQSSFLTNPFNKEPSVSKPQAVRMSRRDVQAEREASARAEAVRFSAEPPAAEPRPVRSSPASPGKRYLHRDVHGVVRFFKDDKGYGFIQPDNGVTNGKDVFVHASGIVGEGRLTLRRNQRVSFDITEDPKGPRAENVEPI